MKRILIVEDQMFVAWELQETLIAAGFAVLGPVASVRGALELLRIERPDAAILDANLDGEWVTKVAQNLNANGVPFLLTSGYAQADLQSHPVLGAAVNLGKPTSADRLLRELGRLLR